MAKCPNCFFTVPPPPQADPRVRGRQGQPPQPPDEERPTRCPNCQQDYPTGWVDVETTCIVLAGARTTGKSVYIGVLIKQLEHLAESIGLGMSPASLDVRQRFEEWYAKPLYQQRGIVIPTPSITTGTSHQREPLVWILTMPDGRRHHLVIRDVAGEDLEPPDPQRNKRELSAEELPFFAHADAVFFLFDPLKVDDIVLHLRGLVPRQRYGEDPRVVLDKVLQLIGHGRPRLAVIMSKFDAMQALANVEGGEWSRIMQNAGAAFYRDPGLFGRADEADGILLHEEIRSLLIMLRASALVATVEREGAAAGYRFFAVSALGEPPNGHVLNPRGIAPFRCLDPLRWALAGKGVI